MLSKNVLSYALYLALVAPTDEKARAASDLAEQIAVSLNMTESQVESAKRRALELAGMES